MTVRTDSPLEGSDTESSCSVSGDDYLVRSFSSVSYFDADLSGPSVPSLSSSGLVSSILPETASVYFRNSSPSSSTPQLSDVESVSASHGASGSLAYSRCCRCVSSLDVFEASSSADDVALRQGVSCPCSVSGCECCTGLGFIHPLDIDSFGCMSCRTAGFVCQDVGSPFRSVVSVWRRSVPVRPSTLPSSSARQEPRTSYEVWVEQRDLERETRAARATLSPPSPVHSRARRHLILPPPVLMPPAFGDDRCLWCISARSPCVFAVDSTGCLRCGQVGASCSGPVRLGRWPG